MGAAFRCTAGRPAGPLNRAAGSVRGPDAPGDGRRLHREVRHEGCGGLRARAATAAPARRSPRAACHRPHAAAPRHRRADRLNRRPVPVVVAADPVAAHARPPRPLRHKVLATPSPSAGSAANGGPGGNATHRPAGPSSTTRTSRTSRTPRWTSPASGSSSGLVGSPPATQRSPPRPWSAPAPSHATTASTHRDQDHD